MPRYELNKQDIENPERLLRHLNRMIDQEYRLLQQIETLKSDLSQSRQSINADMERALRSLELGGPDSVLPSQRASIPKYDELPGESGFAEGDVISVSGTFYMMDSGKWVQQSLGAHASTHYAAGTDPLTGDLDANARVGVRLNSGATTHLRRRINFIPGSSRISLSMADDATDEEVDLTLSLPANNHTWVNSSGSVLVTNATLTARPTTALTIPTNGLYILTATALWDSNATGSREVLIRTNGTTEWTRSAVLGNASRKTGLSAAVAAQLTAGDTLDIQLYHDSGGDLNVWWSIEGTLIH